nr:unnamed protein product [Digitaria exilis]
MPEQGGRGRASGRCCCCGGGPAVAAEGGVPVVLDGVVGAAVEHPRDGGPLVAVLGVRGDDEGVLVGREGAALHAGAELVAPPETARLARSPRDLRADHAPVPRAVASDGAAKQVVLLRRPRPPHPPAPAPSSSSSSSAVMTLWPHRRAAIFFFPGAAAAPEHRRPGGRGGVYKG